MRYHDYDKDRIMFQFHKGSINTILARLPPLFVPRFNSIKVRLIHPNVLLDELFVEFQFHKGSINTMSGISNLLNSSAFQFHKGSINTSQTTSIRFRLICFNSIKVRLIPEAITTLTLMSLFQFHKGSINTVNANPLLADCVVFQFHKGSINTCHFPCFSCQSYNVSIP